MKKTGIVVDSHSSIPRQEAEKLGIRILPMPFYIDGECYYEETTLARDVFFEKLESGAAVSTSQPSQISVMNIWEEALQEYEEILYIPISSGLSGSCSTAMALAQEDTYRERVFVVDNGRVATPLYRSVLDALSLIEKGYAAKEIKGLLEEAKDNMVIYIAVDTLKYLKEGGRVSPAAAAIGTVLNIKPILKLSTGILEPYMKCRGLKKAKEEMILAMKRDLETRFAEECEKGEVYMLAANSAEQQDAALWVQEIREAFPGMEVLSADLSMGVCCHTGKNAYGIGCSCRVNGR